MDDIDLLRQELSKILQQLQEEDEGDKVDIEEIHGVNLKELEKTFEGNQPKMPLEYVKIDPKAVTPTYNYPTDSGFDLHTTKSFIIPPFGRVLAPTGLKFNIKEGFEIQVRPKSGLALKQGLTVLNTPGTVDSGYDGEVQVILYNSTQNSIEITEGQKVAQACLCPVVNGRWVDVREVQEIKDKDRGSNGFGSTGIV